MKFVKIRLTLQNDSSRTTAAISDPEGEGTTQPNWTLLKPTGDLKRDLPYRGRAVYSTKNPQKRTRPCLSAAQQCGDAHWSPIRGIVSKRTASLLSTIPNSGNQERTRVFGSGGAEPSLCFPSIPCWRCIGQCTQRKTNRATGVKPSTLYEDPSRSFRYRDQPWPPTEMQPLQRDHEINQ